MKLATQRLSPHVSVLLLLDSSQKMPGTLRAHHSCVQGPRGERESMLIDGQPYITLDHRPSDALCRNDGGHDLPNAAMVDLATNDRLIETRLSIMFECYTFYLPLTPWFWPGFLIFPIKFFLQMLLLEKLMQNSQKLQGPSTSGWVDECIGKTILK